MVRAMRHRSGWPKVALGLIPELDTAKIGSAGRVEIHRARLLAAIRVRKTFPHGLDPKRSSVSFINAPSRSRGDVGPGFV